MNKKILLFLMMLMPLLASADSVEIEGIWYNFITSGKVAEVIQKPNYSFYSGNIIIPEKVTYEGVEYTVTKIADNAFNSCKDLTSITIPSSVTTIGESAFFYCNSLTSITIPSGVTNIGYSTFSYCSGLTSITIPSSVTNIDSYAFHACI